MRGVWSWSCYWDGPPPWTNVEAPRGATVKSCALVVTPQRQSIIAAASAQQPAPIPTLLLVFDCPDVRALMTTRTIAVVRQGEALAGNVEGAVCVGGFVIENPTTGWVGWLVYDMGETSPVTS